MLEVKVEKQYKEHKDKLEDIYSELLHIFHENIHYEASKNIHNAIFEVDRAIKVLTNNLQSSHIKDK